MKNVKVTDKAHERLSKAATKESTPIHQFHDAIFTIAMDMYDAGEIVLEPIRAIRPGEGESAPLAAT